uniref:Major tail protein n=1 Tax=Siphoviridae sp. ctREU2 TaxID=2826333 RepID=A0A8S5NJL2_9CAUD|nr:MAG TPA: major tail protein [Siphoviridae sp. ctREU2]
MGKPINGSDLMIFLDLEGTGENYKSIAFATSHSLSISAETVETSSKDTGGKWVSKAPRKLSWTMNTENLYSVDGEGSTYDDLFTIMTDRKELDVVFSLEKDYATKKDEVPTGGWTPITTGQYKGKVVITSLELNAPNGDNATFTASFEGVGALTKI